MSIKQRVTKLEEQWHSGICPTCGTDLRPEAEQRKENRDKAQEIFNKMVEQIGSYEAAKVHFKQFPKLYALLFSPLQWEG